MRVVDTLFDATRCLIVRSSCADDDAPLADGAEAVAHLGHHALALAQDERGHARRHLRARGARGLARAHQRLRARLQLRAALVPAGEAPTSRSGSVSETYAATKKIKKSARRVRKRLRAGWGEISRTPSPIPAAPHPPKRAQRARSARSALRRACAALLRAWGERIYFPV